MFNWAKQFTKCCPDRNESINITTIFANFKSYQNLFLFVKKEVKWSYKKTKSKKSLTCNVKGIVVHIRDSTHLDSALSRTALISLILRWSGKCSALRSLSLILVSLILKHTSTAGKYAAFDLGIFFIPTLQSHKYSIYQTYFLTLKKCIKGSVSKDFWPPFFSWFEPIRVPDKQAKVFSNFV